MNRRDWLQTAYEDKGRLPLRHRSATITNGGPWSAAYQQVLSRVGTGCVTALIGNRGAGKTQIGVCVAREVIRRELMAGPVKSCPALYLKSSEVFLEIRECYGKTGPSEKQVIARLLSPRMLVIDEIQDRGVTPWEDRILTHIVDRRYDAMVDTLLIGNRTPDELQSELGASIMSRLQETGDIIECAWASLREVPAHQRGPRWLSAQTQSGSSG